MLRVAHKDGMHVYLLVHPIQIPSFAAVLHNSCLGVVRGGGTPAHQLVAPTFCHKGHMPCLLVLCACVLLPRVCLPAFETACSMPSCISYVRYLRASALFINLSQQPSRHRDVGCRPCASSHVCPCLPCYATSRYLRCEAMLALYDILGNSTCVCESLEQQVDT